MNEVWVLTEVGDDREVRVRAVFATLEAARDAALDPLTVHEREGLWSSRWGESQAERFTVHGRREAA